MGKEILEHLIQQNLSINQIAKRCGCSNSMIRYWLEKHGLTTNYCKTKSIDGTYHHRIDILDRKNDILQWIKEKLPKHEISKRLQCKQSTLNTYLKKMGITYEGQVPADRNSNFVPVTEYLNNTRHATSGYLLKKLVHVGLKQRQCEICGIDNWNDKPIVFELHHKNGIHSDNTLGNLQVLCPNCHSQTSNHRGKAIKIARANV